MAIKVLVLKSGEDLIADVQEMVNDKQQVIGYFLTKPVAVKLKTVSVPTPEEYDPETDNETELSITMMPWVPLARDRTIPLSTDWVVTMVTPVEKVLDMYEKDVLKKEPKDGKTYDQVTHLDDPRDVGLTD